MTTPLRLAIGLVIVATAVVGVSVVSDPASASKTQPDGEAVNVTTSYNSTTPDQLIRVVVQIRAETESLSEIRIRTASTQQSLVEPSSYTTKVAPANRNVSVVTAGDGNFRIEELAPGERVTISFAVTPTTLGQTELDAAHVSVEYVQLGDSLTEEAVATADMRSNPWFALRETQQRADRLASQADTQNTALYTGLAVGILGVLAGAGTEIRRRRRIQTFEEELQEHLTTARRDLNATDRSVIERIATKFDVELTETQPDPYESENVPTAAGPDEPSQEGRDHSADQYEPVRTESGPDTPRDDRPPEPSGTEESVSEEQTDEQDSHDWDASDLA